MSAEPICSACGMQYPAPRPDCPVCLDERQYIPPAGQQWTSLDQLRAGDSTGTLRAQGPGVTGVGTTPKFAIGQRALLLDTDRRSSVPSASGPPPSGTAGTAGTANILWDCVAYFDDDLADAILGRGGISSIAISHPHYYSTMVEWSRAFDAPIYVHAKDRQWVGRPDSAIEFWDGTAHDLAAGLTLLNLGVHFAGGTVLHWADAPGGAGALLSGDIVQVIPDRNFVGFMYSYPNLIPERPDIVRKAAGILEPYPFESLYGAWWDAVIPTDADAVVQRSATRYCERVRETPVSTI